MSPEIDLTDVLLAEVAALHQEVEAALGILAEKQAAIAVLAAGWHPYQPGAGLELRERIVADLASGVLDSHRPVVKETVFEYAAVMGVEPRGLHELHHR